MKGIKDHAIHLFGGAIICAMIISFLGFLFQMGSRIADALGIWGLLAIIGMSYLIGWVFFRSLDDRVKKNANPKMIHYNLSDLKKKD